MNQKSFVNSNTNNFEPICTHFFFNLAESLFKYLPPICWPHPLHTSSSFHIRSPSIFVNRLMEEKHSFSVRSLTINSNQFIIRFCHLASRTWSNLDGKRKIVSIDWRSSMIPSSNYLPVLRNKRIKEGNWSPIMF